MDPALFLPGCIITLMGGALLAFPPRKPTWWRGYRTWRSMRSQQAWEESNRLAAQLLLFAGLLSLNTGITCWFLTRDPRTAEGIVALATVVLLVVVVVITEMDLARNFDREGRRRG